MLLTDMKDKTHGREKMIKIISDNRNPNLKLSFTFLHYIKNTNKIFIFFLQPAYVLAILCKLCNAGHDICI